MFSQTFRRQQPQQQLQPNTQQLGIYQQLQVQQNRSFSQTQYDKENSFTQLLTSTKKQQSFEPIQEQPQQINEVYRILEQLQSMMTSKFNDFQTTLNEHEKIIKPLIEQNAQLNVQLNTVLQQSEKVLQQLTINLEKSEAQLKKKTKPNDLGPVQQLLTKLDERLSTLSEEVEQIATSNNRFQVHVMEIVNVDKIEHRDNMQRVLLEMDKAKRSLSKKLKR